MLTKIFAIGLVFMMVGAMVGGLPPLVKQAGASPGTIYVPDDHSTIQWAVDNATSGDTIIVRDGTYTENIDVNKTLTIQSENGIANCVVGAASSSDHVFDVSADWVNIIGFTVKNATAAWPPAAGIYLSEVSHCNISSNNATGNYHGIRLYYSSNNNTITNNTANSNYGCGIFLDYRSNNNTLTNNTCLNNHDGIFLKASSNNNTLTNNTANSNTDIGIRLSESSSYNTLMDNIANLNYADGIYLYSSCSNNTLTNNTVSNNGYGIKLSSSSNNTLTNNTMSGNDYNFAVSGSSLSHYIQKIDTSNKVDGKPTYYWVNHQDEQVPGDAGFVGVVNSTNITVKDLTLTKNGQGVLLAYTDNSRIENVTVSSNYAGISLESSSSNTLTNNTASNNSHYCIFLYSSSNNNTITNNTANSNYYGIRLHSSSNNTLINSIASNNTCYGISLESSSSNTLTNNTANSNDWGIWLYSSSNNTLTNNTASNNSIGIRLYSSNNSNTLTNNTANSNDWGIWLYSSSDNTIYNNYFNNTNNAYDDGTNTWNTTKTPGTNIIGGLYLGGNYWSDYNANDTNGDGFGETPYNITGGSNKDYLPLVPPAAPPPVGGTIYPMNKLTILAPWIALLGAIIAGASVLTLRRRRT